MYKNIQGAVFDGDSKYTLPCDTRINASVVFGSNEYPIHPIDMVNTLNIDDSGNVFCTGTFTYADPSIGAGTSHLLLCPLFRSSYNVHVAPDFILGDAFMRNVYTSFDFGNWIQGGTHDPFIQILSVTDVKKANAEFETLLKARIQSMQQNCGADDSSALCGQNLV